VVPYAVLRVSTIRFTSRGVQYSETKAIASDRKSVRRHWRLARGVLLRLGFLVHW